MNNISAYWAILNYSEKPGGYSRFQVTRMIEWRQKSKQKKKIPGPKINPPKNPMPNFQSFKISRKQNRFGYTLLARICASTTTNLQIVLNTPKIPAKLSHPKNFDHPCHLKFRVQMKRLRVAYQPVALFLFCFVFFFHRQMMTLHIASVKHFSFLKKILTTTLS